MGYERMVLECGGTEVEVFVGRVYRVRTRTVNDEVRFEARLMGLGFSDMGNPLLEFSNGVRLACPENSWIEEVES
jgi:hypothetical protein